MLTQYSRRMAGASCASAAIQLLMGKRERRREGRSEWRELTSDLLWVIEHFHHFSHVDQRCRVRACVCVCERESECVCVCGEKRAHFTPLPVMSLTDA